MNLILSRILSHFVLLLDVWAFLVWVYQRHRNFHTFYPGPTHFFPEWPLSWRLTYLCEDWWRFQETLRHECDKMNFRIQCLDYFSTCHPEAKISGEDPWYQVHLDIFGVLPYPLNLWNITKRPYPKRLPNGLLNQDFDVQGKCLVFYLSEEL